MPTAKRKKIRNILFSREARNARSKAERYARDPEEAKRLLHEVAMKTKASKSQGPLIEVWDHLTALSRLLHAYFHGKYKTIPWQSLALSSMALIYFLTPSDLFPDFIPVAGYVDDATIIAFVANTIKADLNKFLEWEAGKCKP